jgi:histidine phosphotransfer protein HptB
MIHWSRVNELRDEVGTEDFDDVVQLFLEEVEEVIGRLREKADLGQLEQDLHFLKGSALSLGFAAFSELCQDGERKSANGQPETVDVPAIVTGFSHSKSLFMAELPEQIGA